MDARTAENFRGLHPLEPEAGEAASSGITLSTLQATTSGTAFTFGSIPSGTKQIIMTFEDVSLTGTDLLLVRIGDAGGIETTGYTASSANLTTGSNVMGNVTNGFLMQPNSATASLQGQSILSLMDESTNLWVFSTVVALETNVMGAMGGSKALSAELTQIQLTRSGSNTFDAGAVNIQFQ